MIFRYSKLNITFYVSIFLAFILLIVPPRFKMGVYGPNFLGWFWTIILIPVSLITFLWLLVLDIKGKRKKELLKRTILFFIIIGASVAYWLYQTKKNRGF